MGFGKEKMKQMMWLIFFAAVMAIVVIYGGTIWNGVRFLIGIMTPFIIGGAIAFVLNIPLRAMENGIFKKWKGKSAKLLKRTLSIILSILFVFSIMTAVILIVVPKLTETLGLLGEQVPKFLVNVIAWLEDIAANNPVLMESIQELENIQVDWNSIIDKVGNFLATGMTNVLGSVVNVASSILGGILNTVIAFIFSIYVLSQKEKLADQGHRILKAYLPGKWCERTETVFTLLNKNFSKFISGQCIEALILGAMFVITMSIFRLPYALLIGVLIAFTSLIPIVGAFIGCFIGAFLILMTNPLQALWFIILFIIIQQIEGNLIYPYVVGNSVGLPSIWVLVAVSIGGSLFGVLGMLCFIPLTATFYTLLRDSVNMRNSKVAEVVATEPENSEKEPISDEEESTN